MNRAKARPAETGGLAAAVVALIVYGLGIDDPAMVAPLIIAVGAVPAAITFLVETVRGRRAQDGG